MGQSRFQQLLTELQHLWHQLRVLFWARRLDGDKARQARAEDHGGWRPLSDYIDVDTEAEQVPPGEREGAADSGARATPAMGRKKPFIFRTLGIFDDLSRYLRRRGRRTSLQPRLADKLKKSTWEHVRTAALAARNGNRAKAKLYADLADNAMKEAARYMPADEFRVFRQEIEDTLKAKSRD